MEPFWEKSEELAPAFFWSRPGRHSVISAFE
jgi:hypothetical protein